MHRLTPVVQNYAWGSYDGLARISGRPFPTAVPEAELWMGAHEAAPSELGVDDDRTTLDQAIASDPVAWLGPAVADRFGGRLPFLLKVLAPAKALSIQVHPDPDRAASAPQETYVDTWPKPEAWVAVEPTEAFVGSRPFDEVRSLASHLGVAGLSALVERAASTDSPAHELLRLVLGATDPEALVGEVLDACASRANDLTVAAVLRVAEHFPHDVGLVVLLTMRHRSLEPGDHVFLDAGVLHSLTSGLVVEVLANSDNVVRAGLTLKKIDVPELLHIVDVDSQVRVEPGADEDGWTSFAPHTPYFRLDLTRLSGAGARVPGDQRPRIVLCLDGSAQLTTDGDLWLESGESAYLLPGEEVTATGDGTLYVAAPGLD
ncbi:mannose-6-phosphate isomerase, class I [Luteipulveratus sp. YIM 133132]|uniref:mannose-6-phosphate isomerase, class I n=1 Tax=Luteipulveratus flavus TaxID=3031728 RepID=UPI0023AF676E|nr:mannose-6-phosphate isomerase, class I [Luteipulveratus sp. YIM 133132]MDE9365536.1 mannose-6-phosphate isomerase, class I [Luteipulveratus sp. YIM 133132]